jgi:hypothetical protein
VRFSLLTSRVFVSKIIGLFVVLAAVPWPIAPNASAGGPAASAAVVNCTKYAAPPARGRARRNPQRGTRKHPFRSLQRLDVSLYPGQTGCLEGGTYGGLHTWYDLVRNGRPSAPITITAAPRARVKVVGWIALEGSYTTLSGLNIDDSNTFGHSQDSSCPNPVSQGLAITGHDDVLEHNNIYQSVARLRSTGIGVGWNGDPNNTIIRYNRIHDVGSCLAYDHIIYLSHGNNVQIYDNWMWNDRHGWGIQIYPGPDNARIFDNVIDHAGSGLVIADQLDGATNNNQAYHNVVLNSTGIYTGSASFRGVLVNSPGVTGTGNQVFQNDSWRNRGGIANIDHSVSRASVRVSGNTKTNPRFVNSHRHDYRLRPTSPLLAWGLWNG